MDDVAPRLGIPAYFYPHADSAYWAQLANAAPAVALVVANPSNGPATAPDPNYVEATALIRSRGVGVLGYVSTGYGDRGLADVLADVSRWYDWYRIDGVFFDEVSTAQATWAYYQALTSSIRARDLPGRIVLNPGTHTAEQYMEICDVLLNYEGTWTTYRDGYLDNPVWIARYPPMRFWHVIHTCPTAAAMHTALALARVRNAGLVFVTTGSGANPYDQLPTGRFWTDQLAWTGRE